MSEPKLEVVPFADIDLTTDATLPNGERELDVDRVRGEVVGMLERTRARLRELRSSRDEINLLIRDLVDTEETVAQLVGVLDRRIAKRGT